MVKPLNLWLLVAQQLLLVATLLAVMLAHRDMTGRQLHGLADAPRAVDLLVYLAVTGVLTWASYRLVQRASPGTSLGLRPSLGRLKQGLLGFLIGAAANSLPWLLAWASGAARLEGHLFDGAHSIVPGFLMGLLVGVLNATFEEATSRAAPLALLRPWPAWRAAAVSSLLFALMHALGEVLSPARLIYLCSLGVLLAWAYLASGHIWLGVGLHAGWFWASLLPSGRFHAGAALALQGDVGGYVLASDALLGLLALFALWRLWRHPPPSRWS